MAGPWRWLPAAALLWIACSPGAPDGGPRPGPADVLVPFGARWSFTDRAEDPPLAWPGDPAAPPAPAWTRPGFDAAAWLRGPAPVGYGVGNEATLLPPAWGSADDDLVTDFRHVFRVDDPAAVQALRLRVVHDDGAVVFLNGTEVARSNVRAELPAPSFPAVIGLFGADERRPFTFWADPALLRRGENVVAARLHQDWPSRADLRFDLELAAVTAAHPLALVRGPYLQSASPTQMTVRWRTNRPVASRVRYGPAPDRLEHEAAGDGPTTDHEVLLRGLEPGTRTYYGLVGGSADALLAGGDADHVFRTPPEPGTRVPVRVLALGDVGTGDARARSVRDGFWRFAGGEPPDVVLLLGDNAYPTGSDADHQHALFDTYPRLLQRVPVWPVLGNHGANLTSPQLGRGPFFDIWTTPTRGESGGPPSGRETFYAFDHGDVRFVAVDSCSDFGPRDPMMRWLPGALDAPQADWVVVYLHHPALSDGTHDYAPGSRTYRLWSALLPVLEAARVDLVLAGHSHTYERSYLLGPSGGKLEGLGERILDAGDGDPDGDGAYRPSGPGTVWVVSGSAGQIGHEGDLEHPTTAVARRQLGALVLDVDGCRLDGRFVVPGGGVRDHFRLDKCPGAGGE